MQACYDLSVSDFPRLPQDRSDSERIQRVIDACPRKVAYLPAGEYEIASPLRITNWCSLLMHKSAHLKAVQEMDFVLTYDGTEAFHKGVVHDENGLIFDDMNLFITGGDVDGNGLASCLLIDNYHHFTLNNLTCHNGKKYGLRVGTEEGKGYELIVNNVYCKCTLSGLAGNVGISSCQGDSHYTDCVIVDYTTGMELLGGGSNRLTRVHVWGGIVPPVREGELSEMLVDSVCFRLYSADAILRDCYADTGMIGFLVGANTRLLGSSYYNNYYFKMDNPTVIRHEAGSLLVSECYFTQTSPHATTYSGIGRDLIWSNNMLNGGLTFPDAKQ